MSSDSPIKSIQELFQFVQEGLEQKKKNFELLTQQQQPITFLWSGEGSAFTSTEAKGQEALAIQIQPIISSPSVPIPSSLQNQTTIDALAEETTPNTLPVPTTQSLPSNLPISPQQSLVEALELGKISQSMPMHVPPATKHHPPTHNQFKKERITKSSYQLSLARTSIAKRDEIIEALKLELKNEREASRSHQTFAENCRQTTLAREMWWEQHFRKTVEELRGRSKERVGQEEVKRGMAMPGLGLQPGIMVGNAPLGPLPPSLHRPLSHAELCYFSAQLFPNSILPLPMQPPLPLQNPLNPLNQIPIPQNRYPVFQTLNPNKHSVHYQRRWAEGMKRYHEAKVYRDPKMVVLKSLFNPAKAPEIPQLVQQPCDSFTLYCHWRESCNVFGGSILDKIVKEWQEIVEKDPLQYADWENRAKEVKDEHLGQIELGCVTVDQMEQRVAVKPY